jgi:hypothetical protein
MRNETITDDQVRKLKIAHMDSAESEPTGIGVIQIRIKFNMEIVIPEISKSNGNKPINPDETEWYNPSLSTIITCTHQTHFFHGYTKPCGAGREC